jgi:hypothetical protein
VMFVTAGFSEAQAVPMGEELANCKACLKK